MDRIFFREIDARYIYLQQKQVVKTIELSDVVKVDLDEEDNLIGIEVLDATQRYSLADILRLKTGIRHKLYIPVMVGKPVPH
jgi:uncharacterized protein YuzE